MATFQVPQFIETKAKIIGPLTLEQFFYLAGAGGLSFLSLTVFNFFLAFILTAIFVATGLAFAFIKVNGQSLPKVFVSAFNYWLRPRLYTWQRIIPEKTLEISEENILNLRKNMTLQEKLKDLAQRVTTGKLSIFEKGGVAQAEERYQVVKRLTGEREVAKRVDYS